MQWPVCALLLAITGGVVSAACGNLEDERPRCPPNSDPSTCGRPLTVEFLTLQILQPSCGQTQCHSTFHQASGLVFDNPRDVRKSLLTPNGRSAPLLRFTDEFFDPADPTNSNFIQWLLPLNDTNKEVGRMPFDAPLPAIDLQLLKVWLGEPAKDANDMELESGASAAGAQCDPDLYEGLACNGELLVECGDDFNFAEIVTDCAKGCRLREPCIKPDPDDAMKCLETGPAVAECAP